MRKSLAILGVLSALAACGDPLADLPRLDDVELAENDPAAQALPSEDEIAREGFFGTDAALAEVGTGLSDTQTTEPVTTTATETTAPARRGGLLGLFRGAAAAAPAAAPASVEAAEEATPAPTEIAALPAEAAARPDPRSGGGFLSGLFRPGTNAPAAKSDLPEVTYGTVLPYGVIARNCSARRQPMGSKVESAAGGYLLYDSNPQATGLRTFYITGFDDGCPRQLTAAHVLLGAPSLYELLHYGPAGAHLAVGETDRAYEKVKAQVCGVRQGKPCGSRISRLERSTVFVNAYPRADDNTTWSEMLIHQGDVVATADKSS